MQLQILPPPTPTHSPNPSTLPQFRAAVLHHFPDIPWKFRRKPYGALASHNGEYISYSPKDLKTPWKVELEGEGGEGRSLEVAIRSAKAQKLLSSRKFRA